MRIFFVALVVGIALGYWWASQAYRGTYEPQIAQYEKEIAHYKATWMPIKQKHARKE